MSDRPLITLAVFSYNQERYIRQAVEGALSQTYRPLEIILSDDCSSDRSFEIMEKAVAAYDGPHAVRLNRMGQNSGAQCGHMNRLVGLVNGLFLVKADGDDVSLPDRVSSLHEAWQRTGGAALVLNSNYSTIDEDGNVIRDRNKSVRTTDDGGNNGKLELFARTLINFSHGCTSAYHRRLFEGFGSLPDRSFFDDVLLSCRAMLLGKIDRIDETIAYVDEPLVMYRTYTANSDASCRHFIAGTDDYLRRAIKLNHDRIVACEHALQCALEVASKGNATQTADLDRLQAELRKTRRFFEIKHQVFTGTLATRIVSLVKYLGRAQYHGDKDAKKMVVLAMSKKAYFGFRKVRGWISR